MRSFFAVFSQSRRMVALLLGWLVIAFLITSNLPLHYDEAYYWVLSNHLDLGYYDHPPLTVYLLRLSRIIFGENEFAVRLPSVLFQSISICLIFLYLFDLTKNNKIAFWWSAVYSVIPLAFLWGGLGMNSDAGVITFSILSTMLFKKAIHGARLINWIYFGVSFGLGVITKFTFPTLLPGLFLYLVLDRRRRRFLWRKEIYVSILVAILVFIPFLIWNVQHDFATFRFNFLIRHIPWHFRGWYLQNTIQLMFILFGPVPLILSTGYVLRSLRKLKGLSDKLDPTVYIQLTLIPIFIYIGSGSLIKWHYMIVLCFPIVVNALLFFYRSDEVGMYYSDAKPKVVMGVTLASIIIPVLAMSMVVGVVIKTFREPQTLFGETPPELLVDPRLNRDATTLFGSTQAGEYLDKLVGEYREKGYGDLFIVASDYREASQLSFYAPSHSEIFLLGYTEMFGRNYILFRQKSEASLLHKNAILVTQYPSAIPNLTAFFTDSQEVAVFEVKDHAGNTLKLYYFYLCLDYQGDTTGLLDIDVPTSH